MKNIKNKMKKVMAMMMMTCMLLTVVNVSSNEGIMTCGEEVIETEVHD